MVTRKQVFTGAIWLFLERCGAQGISFIVTIILARILSPNDYGTVALITVFIGILQVFLNSGFTSALVQKKDADNVDFSTVLYFNLLMGAVLYTIVFFLAPYIAGMYHKPELCGMMRVIGINLIVFSVKGVQTSYVERNLLFKKYFFSTLGGTIFSSVVGITMASLGFGAWSLVFQNLSNNFIDAVILWAVVGWRPYSRFSISSFKQLFSFAWKLMLSAFLDNVYSRFRELVIGTKYTSEDLAYYSRGESFPYMLTSLIDSTINSVLFPTMSASQDNWKNIKNMMRRSIQVSTYVLMPVMMGLAVCADSMVKVLLTEKWTPCVIFIRIACFSYALWPINTANQSAINAVGRSDIFLKIETIKKFIGIIAIASSMWFGVKAIAYSMIVVNLSVLLIYSLPNRKMFDYGFFEQIWDIKNQIVLTVLMGVIVSLISYFNTSDMLRLILQIIIGVSIYILGSMILKIESFDYVVLLIRQLLSKEHCES